MTSSAPMLATCTTAGEWTPAPDLQAALVAVVTVARQLEAATTGDEQDRLSDVLDRKSQQLAELVYTHRLAGVEQ